MINLFKTKTSECFLNSYLCQTETGKRNKRQNMAKSTRDQTQQHNREENKYCKIQEYDLDYKRQRWLIWKYQLK